jgi:hypothetical protein
MSLFDEDVESSRLRAEALCGADVSVHQRSGRAGVHQIRALMDAWFARYPAAHRNELRQRIRYDDDHQCLAAFFELLLYELFLRLGCRPVIHPPPPDNGKAPRFSMVAIRR